MDWAFDITLKNRTILKHFLDNLSLEELNTIPKGFSNNIIWNIAHLIATQQILVYILSGRDALVGEEFIGTYKKGTRPEKAVTNKEIQMLKELLFSTIEQTKIDYAQHYFKEYKTYTVSTKNTLTSVEEAIEFNNFHEGIHLGYIFALRKFI